MTVVPDPSGSARNARGQAEGEEGAGFPWRMVSASVLTISVAMLPGFLPGALAIQLADDFDITVAGVGVVVGVFFTVAALASPVMGRVAERTSWAPSMRLAALVAAANLGLTAFLATSVTTLALIAIVGGVGVALAQPATNLGLARCTVKDRQGLAYGFKHAAVPAAVAFAGFAVPVVAIPLGWEWVFLIAAIVAVFAALFIPFDPLRYEVHQGPDVKPEVLGRLSTPLPLLIVLAIGAALGLMGIGGLATFLVLYSVDVGFSAAAAGALLALGSVFGISMRLFAGWKIDRRAAGGFSTVAVFLVTGAIGLAVVGSGVQVLVVVGSLVAFTFGWGWAGLFTFSVVRANQAAPAASTAITQTGSFVGGAVGPVVFGIIAEGISFTVAWIAMAIFLVAAGGLVRFASGRLPS